MLIVFSALLLCSSSSSSSTAPGSELLIDNPRFVLTTAALTHPYFPFERIFRIYDTKINNNIRIGDDSAKYLDIT